MKDILKPKMGFEKRRTFTVDWHNKPEQKYGYTFKSKIERKWADYLESLKHIRAIESWGYETRKFDCGSKYNKKRVYTPDFEVVEDGIHAFHEVKTALRQHDVSRFKWLRQAEPDLVIILVLPYCPTGKTKSGARQIELISNAEKYVNRIVYANPLFKKFGIV
jgi:hypothetical protein